MDMIMIYKIQHGISPLDFVQGVVLKNSSTGKSTKLPMLYFVCYNHVHPQSSIIILHIIVNL